MNELTKLCCLEISNKINDYPLEKLNSDVLYHWNEIIGAVPQNVQKRFIWCDLTTGKQRNWYIFNIFLHHAFSKSGFSKSGILCLDTFVYNDTNNFMFKFIESTRNSKHIWDNIYKIFHLDNQEIQETESFQFEQIPRINKVFGLSCIFPNDNIMNHKLNNWIQISQIQKTKWEHIRYLMLPQLSNAKIIYQLLLIMPNLKFIGFDCDTIDDIPVLRRNLKLIDPYQTDASVRREIYWFKHTSEVRMSIEPIPIQSEFPHECFKDRQFMFFKPYGDYEPSIRGKFPIYQVLGPIPALNSLGSRNEKKLTPGSKLKKPRIGKGTIFGLNKRWG